MGTGNILLLVHLFMYIDSNLLKRGEYNTIILTS